MSALPLRLAPVSSKLDGVVACWKILEQLVESVLKNEVPKLEPAEKVHGLLLLVVVKLPDDPRLLFLCRAPVAASDGPSELLNDGLKHFGHLLGWLEGALAENRPRFLGWLGHALEENLPHLVGVGPFWERGVDRLVREKFENRLKEGCVIHSAHFTV